MLHDEIRELWRKTQVPLAAYFAVFAMALAFRFATSKNWHAAGDCSLMVVMAIDRIVRATEGQRRDAKRVIDECLFAGALLVCGFVVAVYWF